MSIRTAPLHIPPQPLTPDRTPHDPLVLPPVSLLEQVRCHRTAGKPSLAGAVEDCFLSKFDSIDYDLNAVTVKSTIAIALSPDGSTVATTHGDHTVKIFKYADASLFRVFVGHPRTPWTVKYHYTNSDIVASGCLGYEVFVWSISENCKINSIRYANSIISLSFQPHGPYIAVASGMELRLWNWSEDARLSIDGPTGRILQSRTTGAGTAGPGGGGGEAAWKQCPRMKIVRHPRNIRAVIFHPFGRVLFVAAPDVTDKEATALVYSRLYAFDINSISIDPESDIEAASSAVNLTTLPSILPQVHLYSDGGIDVSPDGNFLFVCCSLYLRSPSAFLSRTASGDTVDGLTRGLSGLELEDDDLCNLPVIKDAKREDTTGHVPLSSLCLYRFRYPLDDTIDLTIPAPGQSHGFRNELLRDTPFPQLELVKYRPIKEVLLKAITTVKLSPTCRYGLLGYGVRADGLVKGHTYGHITSEIVLLEGGDMELATKMTDEVDEVNIAQFHPLPGGGIIYGTKLGRVRVFKRANMINNK